MAHGISAIDLFVADKERAKDFYMRAFDLEPVHEDDHGVVFRLENAYLFLAAPAAAQHALVEPATVAHVGQGPRQVFGIFVPDVDAVCRDLAAKGIALLNGPENRSWGMRTASIQDPDGNVWAFETDVDDA